MVEVEIDQGWRPCRLDDARRPYDLRHGVVHSGDLAVRELLHLPSLPLRRLCRVHRGHASQGSGRRAASCGTLAVALRAVAVIPAARPASPSLQGAGAGEETGWLRNPRMFLALLNERERHNRPLSGWVTRPDA